MSFLGSLSLSSWMYFHKELILKALKNTHAVESCLLNIFLHTFDCKHLFLCTRYEQTSHRRLWILFEDEFKKFTKPRLFSQSKNMVLNFIFFYLLRQLRNKGTIEMVLFTLKGFSFKML